MNFVITILAVGMLIVFHELGHFFAAKSAGVQVNEFWIGMGPCLFKKEYKGTVYKLNLLPFGGAVVMEGEDAESSSENSFSKTTKLNKAIIMSAGCFMNFLIGFIIVFALSSSVFTTKIESFATGFNYSGPEALMVGDTILTINNYDIISQNDVTYALSLAQDDTHNIKLLRDGNDVELVDFKFEPELLPNENNELIMRYGLNFESKKLSFFDRVATSVDACIIYTKDIFTGFKMLITGQTNIEDMTGIVGITVYVGQVAKYSMTMFWEFIAIISINLGVMNLLPIPALDGGRLLLLLVETIRKKPLNPKVEGIIHGVSLLILLGLMLFLTFHDIFIKLM